MTSDTHLQRRNKEEVAYYDTLDHNMTTVLKSSPYEDVFGTNASCILGRAETIGPYYVEGELIRSNVTEDQVGIPMHLEMQFIDVNTCKPVPALFIDLWGANATGGYSGAEVPTGYFGLPVGGLNSTFLRGIQITDEHGVVSFDQIIPGHYYPRATHTHLVAWGNATTYANGTIAGGLAADDTFIRYIGQLYYEQKLRDAVDPIFPYNTNADTANIKNVDDYILAENATINGNTVGDLGEYDPFVKYIYLTNDLADGVFAWHTIGIDMNGNFNDGFVAAAKYEEDGGRALNEWGAGTVTPFKAVMPPKGTTTTVTTTATSA
ncbi:Intradiol ring-cleavage dioxygenase [Leptodontidium sp. 2 PMI_412]|nr:Intradiol ring-cleavage dioxygenase [Leptodontidium sp. 2 PMI_412]